MSNLVPPASPACNKNQPFLDDVLHREGAFQTHASRALALGLTPLPLANRKYGPVGWPEMSLDEVAEIVKTGFAPGKYGPRSTGGADLALRGDGIVILDIDTDNRDIRGTVWRVLTDHGLTQDDLIGRRGTKGAALLFRDPGGEITSFSLQREARNTPPGEGAVFFEVLAGPKRMITWPPSLHRKTGQPYTEIGRSIWDIEDVEELPVCTPSLVRDLRAALAPFTKKEPERKSAPSGIEVKAHDLDETQRKRFEAYAQTALSKWTATLASLDGGRRRRCYELGCRIGVYVHHGILSADEIEDAVKPAWAACGGAQKHGENGFKLHLRNGINLGKSHLVGLRSVEILSVGVRHDDEVGGPDSHQTHDHRRRDRGVGEEHRRPRIQGSRAGRRIHRDDARRADLCRRRLGFVNCISPHTSSPASLIRCHRSYLDRRLR